MACSLIPGFRRRTIDWAGARSGLHSSNPPTLPRHTPPRQCPKSTAAYEIFSKPNKKLFISSFLQQTVARYGFVEATGGGVDCAGFLSLILIMNFRTSSIRESQQKVHVSRLVPECVSSSKTQRLSGTLPANLRAPAPRPRRLRPPRTLTTTPPHLRALRAPQEAERTHLGRRS